MDEILMLTMFIQDILAIMMFIQDILAIVVDRKNNDLKVLSENHILSILSMCGWREIHDIYANYCEFLWGSRKA